MKKLLFVAAIFGVIALFSKKARQNKAAFQGLTEAEARDRIVHHFPEKVPEERRDAIADTIVSKMRDRGILSIDELEKDETIELNDTSTQEPADAV
jgi:hypothetical protein